MGVPRYGTAVRHSRCVPSANEVTVEARFGRILTHQSTRSSPVDAYAVIRFREKRPKPRSDKMTSRTPGTTKNQVNRLKLGRLSTWA